MSSVFPPALADLAKVVAVKRDERRQHDRDLVAEVVAAFPIWRKRYLRDSDEEILGQALDAAEVPDRDCDWVARRARLQLGLPAYMIAEPELKARWKTVQAAMHTSTGMAVRQALRDAQANELDAMTTLELCEAAL